MEKEQFEILCASHALGTIEPEEQVLLDEALATGGEEFRTIFRESAYISYAINSGVKRAIPSPLVRSRILKQIQFGDRTPSTLVLRFEKLAILLGFGRPGFGLLVAFLLLVVIIEIGASAYVMYGEMDSSVSQSAAADILIADQDLRLKNAAADIEEKNRMIEIINAPALQAVTMTGIDSFSSASGRLLFDPEQKSGLLQYDHLPAAPSGLQYFLWLVDRSKQGISAGAIARVDSSSALQYFPALPLPVQWSDLVAISISLDSTDDSGLQAGSIILTGVVQSQGNR
jgi:hypothetical protein